MGKLSFRILMLTVLAWGASGLASAQGIEDSAYPKRLRGEDFFIPGKPVIGYLTVQPRYTTVENEGGTSSDYYSLRRVKLRILGEPLPGWRYYLQGLYKTENFSATDNQIFLQEARVMRKFSPSLQVQIGQFIPPLGLERFIPDEMLYTIDRSQVTDHLVPNGNLGNSFTRDYGLELSGNLSDARLTYALALMGGNGANNGHLGEEGSYLLDGQMMWRPYRSEKGGLNLTLGGAASFRRNQDLNLSQQLPGSSSLGYKHFNGSDEHYNAFLNLTQGPFSFLSEGFYARYRSCRSGLTDLSADGIYAQAAYFLSPRWQAVGKYETFDPNLQLENSANLRWITLGLNYYLLSHRLKFMANYIFKSEGKEGFGNHTFIMQMQFFFGCPSNPRLDG